jgi:hypothetical protein
MQPDSSRALLVSVLQPLMQDPYLGSYPFSLPILWNCSCKPTAPDICPPRSFGTKGYGCGISTFVQLVKQAGVLEELPTALQLHFCNSTAPSSASVHRVAIAAEPVPLRLSFLSSSTVDSLS